MLFQLEKEKISEILSKNLQTASNMTSFDFDDFETNFLNNRLDLSFIFEKKPQIDQQKSSLKKR